MANFKIITNNPMAASSYSGLCDFDNKTVEGIFITCRNMVHKGAILINHPLSGSVKPNVSPYKSLVVSDENLPIDFRSLQLIEDAISTLKKLGVRDNIQYNESVLEDFQVIDLDLLNSAMQSLPPNYHR
ncbi:MAG: GrdX family protein [Defluviitaleaceae bacterium]|nr:GrdX family protein [Defluviitaleaceae bacterium]